MPKVIFNPGPSVWDKQARKYAGWLHIYDLMREAMWEQDIQVSMPQPDQSLMDNQTTVSRITSWDLLSAYGLPKEPVDLFVGPPGYSLAQIMRLKATGTKIVTVVFNNADWFRDQQLAPEFKAFEKPYDLSPAWRWINKSALELSDCVIACSPFVKNTHAKLVPEDKIRIAFWGVDSERFTPDWKWQADNPLPLKILFVGGDPIRKGLSYLLMAAKGLDNVHVTVVGCDPKVTVFGLECNVLGMIPNADMPDLYHRHHVICIPTLEDGIACSIQEGMASGLVPISTPDPSEVFVDNESGFKVNYRDVDGIRNTLIWLRDNLPWRVRLANSARKLAETQTWSKFKSDFGAIISEVLRA